MALLLSWTARHCAPGAGGDSSRRRADSAHSEGPRPDHTAVLCSRAAHTVRPGLGGDPTGRRLTWTAARATFVPSMAGRDDTHWVGTWTAAAPAEGAAFSNHTLRMIPRVSIGGSTLRVRISNACGARPLAIGTAWVGVRSAGPGVVPGSHRRLTFGGEASATVAAGALVVAIRSIWWSPR